MYKTTLHPKKSLTLKKINDLLDRDLIIYWSHEGYYLKKSKDGDIYVICHENDFTTRFEKEDVAECFSYGGVWFND